MFLEVLGEDKVLYFSKRALRADTERNKLLKEALPKYWD